MRNRLIIPALAVLGLFTIGCGVEGLDPESGVTDDPVVVTTTGSTSTSTEDEPGSYQVLYNDPGQMGNFANAVVSDYIEPWLEEEFPRSSYPAMYPLPRLVAVRPGQSGAEACTADGYTPADYTDQSFEYCPADNTVYVGYTILWEFWEETGGDAGAAVGIAHEYGHHIQDALGILDYDTSQDSIDTENQADCLAGAWVHWIESDTTAMEDDDEANIEALFPLIASAEGEAGRDHGTLTERRNAYSQGEAGGVNACI